MSTVRVVKQQGREMAHWVKALATEPVIPEKERTDSCKAPSDLHLHHGIHTFPSMNKRMENF